MEHSGELHSINRLTPNEIERGLADNGDLTAADMYDIMRNAQLDVVMPIVSLINSLPRGHELEANFGRAVAFFIERIYNANTAGQPLAILGMLSEEEIAQLSPKRL